ncbi:hypothetical protein BGZ52_009124, partial [Haplosporangium bisporale]
DRNSTIIPPHSSSPPLVRVGRMRWAILASGCLVLFGNYYAYDNPAALNKPLQQHLGLSDDDGYIADRLGHRRILIWVSVIVVLGHMIVCLGVERRNVPVMIVGRVVFGMAESLSVVQSAMTIKYFRGQELAMALGVNLCMSRLGSVLNDVLTPLIWSRTNVDVAFWGGFVTCVLSLGSALVLVVLDRRQSRKLGDRREREEEDALGHAVRREEDGEEEEKEQEEKWQELSE